jgi:sec-independent protein translocase protein TatA
MSTGEIMLILLFILLFFGSESIPNIARTLGRGLRQIRDAGNEIQQEIRKSADKAVEESGLKKVAEDIRDQTEEGVDNMKKNIRLDQDFEE